MCFVGQAKECITFMSMRVIRLMSVIMCIGIVTTVGALMPLEETVEEVFKGRCWICGEGDTPHGSGRQEKEREEEQVRTRATQRNRTHISRKLLDLR